MLLRSGTGDQQQGTAGGGLLRTALSVQCLFSLLQLRSARDDIGTHHLVVFVLEHVTVPDVASGVAFKFHDDAGDSEGIGSDGIFPSKLAGGEGNGGAGEDDFSGELVDGNIERPAVKHLEADEVEVDGMGVVGQIDE